MSTLVERLEERTAVMERDGYHGTAGLLREAAAALRATGEGEWVMDEGCICRGNWRAIVKESEPLIGKMFNDHKGVPHRFFGVVHAEDDYYYGMWSLADRRLVLLTCCGSIEGGGYTLVERCGDEPESIAAWNQRAHPAQQPDVSALISLRREAQASLDRVLSEQPNNIEGNNALRARINAIQECIDTTFAAAQEGK